MSDEIIEILRGMWGEMKALNGRVDKTNARLDGLRADTADGFAAVRAEIAGGFAMVDRRFDSLLLGAHGQDHADLRQRIGRLEKHVGITDP